MIAQRLPGSAPVIQASKRIVIFMRDPQAGTPFWLTEDYLPTVDATCRLSATVATIKDELPSVRALPVPLPHDCADGVGAAYWRRPEMYLDSHVRDNISIFALAEPESLARGLARLRADLGSGAWDRRYGHLRSLPELDLGHRLLVTELA